MQTEFEIITEGNIKRLPNGAIINRYCHVVKGAEIGENAMIGEHCYIAKGAVIGERTRIQNGVNVFSGVNIADDCFIGPNVSFTNCHYPQTRYKRIKENEEFIPEKTTIGACTVIGAAAVIVAPCVIGSNALIGAGSVVLRDIKAKEKANGIVKGKK